MKCKVRRAFILDRNTPERGSPGKHGANFFRTTARHLLIFRTDKSDKGPTVLQFHNGVQDFRVRVRLKVLFTVNS